MTSQLTKEEREELEREIKIEQERKEHYKKQLQMLKDKKNSGEISDAANFKIESIPIDMRDLMDMERDLK